MRSRCGTAIQSLMMSLLLGLGCARQGFPPGGPEDKTPPEVVATSPLPGAVHVPPTTKVMLTFSERVQRQSVEQALFITPRPAGKPSLRWRRRTLVITFSEPLRVERTYVVTVGTEARDLRNNRLRQAFSLAFSTGDSLDSCAVEGRVYGEGGLAGTAIWAYDLAVAKEPNPSLAPADYVTQCDATGAFALRAMAPGTYRVFAVRDRDANGRYDPEYDALGVAPGDVQLSALSPVFTGCHMRVAVRDTTPPRLESAGASDNRHLHLRFSEPVLPRPVSTPDNFTIVALETMDTVRVLTAYLDAERRSFVHLLTSGLRGDRYKVMVREVRDEHGLPALGLSAEFSGNTSPDTLRPAVVKTVPADSARAVPCALSLDILFSEAMDTSSTTTAISFVDSAGSSIPGALQWSTPAHCIFSPLLPLASRRQYQVRIVGALARDMSGLPLRQDSVQITLWTMNCDTLSSIAGTVNDEESEATGPVVIAAVQVRPQGVRREVTIASPGPYEIGGLLPGVYQLECYRDEDHNGRYSLGSAVPFVPAERFVVLPDSIQVRSRWPNVDNDILLPRWKGRTMPQVER
ncbi:MAG: Ig-like domain-containing protein [candidate division KSB1 bacterium]|nr:Ig-like domain-containing protein [candidate division KSB1 bacterium]